MIKTFKDPKIMAMIRNICKEHWEVAKPSDSNIGYLWYMYAAGTKVGTFRPFIFLAELNLLVKTGYITAVEKDNMIVMLDSSDEDNAHVLAYSILTLRKSRIEDLGLWTTDNDKYSEIDYIRDIINTQMFVGQWQK
ncbi:MAG: hypothetical protein RLZZ196_1911 [Bacteroidota bacterium]|jgi:hypothetical protein